MIDRTDQAILYLLRQDARLQWKEIGDQVHLTGQAVAARIRRMQDLGIIRGFTVQVDQARAGRPINALVTVFMKTTEHGAFRRFLAEEELVEEAHRVSGEGCYWLNVRAASQEELNGFLDRVLAYGNYRVNLSIGQVK